MAAGVSQLIEYLKEYPTERGPGSEITLSSPDVENIIDVLEMANALLDRKAERRGMVIKPKDGRPKVNEGILMSGSYTYLIDGTPIDKYLANGRIEFGVHQFVKVYLELEFVRGDIFIEGLDNDTDKDTLPSQSRGDANRS